MCMERLGHIIDDSVRSGRWQPIRLSNTGPALSHSFFADDLIDDSVRSGRWQPIRLSNTGPALSHCFFADDLIIFGEASVSQAQKINACFERFGASSGQQISKPKSRIYFSANVTDTQRQSLGQELGIPETTNLGRYLGVPVIHGRVSKATFTDLIDRIDRRLAGWKAASLSLAGRITLAQSVISSLPAYTMQTTLLPASVCDYIDKKIRAFIWGSTEQGRKVHLIDWETICRPKEEGGLGLRDSTRTNEAYMLKIAWRMLTKPNDLWARVLRGKYGKQTEEGWTFRSKERLSNLWRGVMRVAHLIEGATAWNVRNGKVARFWSDRWLDDEVILSDHESGLAPEVCNMPVIDFVLNGEGNLEYLRQYLPPTLVLQVGSHPVPTEEADDVRVWRFSERGEFTLRTAYELTEREASTTNVQSVWRTIWKAPTMQRVRSFLWLMNHDRLFTNAERGRRHLTTKKGCKICGVDLETTIHVVRDCPFERATLAEMLGGEPDSLFFEPDVKRWSHYYLSGKSQIIDSTLFAGVCWLLWKNQNGLIFRSELKTHTQIQFQAKQLREQILKAFEKERNIFGDGGLRVRCEIGWQPPAPGWVCVNTDGSVNSFPESTACGGIVRGDDGRFIRAFTANLGGGSITRAELTRIVYGLKLAWEEGARKVVLQTDSATAKSLIETVSPNHPHYTRVAEIQRWLDRPWTVRIDHVYREANYVADHLASVGHSAPTVYHIINSPSSNLAYWLYYDTLGIQTPRLIRTE
ncbi:unnamed protein product [Linum trigynum]|uniref:RNase H type-1 domain-containing protein n=1 Tax=Linum trigynum TaxID=586398 RepID=A0AAV2FY86_9ROSI